MQFYQFERIFSRMEKEFGKIRKGEEDVYDMLFAPMEMNVLKVHRAFPSSNSRRLREAIALTLFDLKERYTGEKQDTENFRNEDNERLEKALLMAFDPFTNPEVMEALGQQDKLADVPLEKLKSYYKVPIMCLLRIKESIDTWEKQGGADGYFEFVEDFFGSHVKNDKMEFTVMNPETLKP